MFFGNSRRAFIAIQRGANIAIIVMNGCRAVASNSVGCDRQNTTPSAVMRMLTKTRPYVRRTSVARSAPERTRVPGSETPIGWFSVGGVEEIYPVDGGMEPSGGKGKVKG